jgi:hypothetical protein
MLKKTYLKVTLNLESCLQPSTRMKIGLLHEMRKQNRSDTAANDTRVSKATA